MTFADPLAAYDHAPEVSSVDGEVVVVGQGVSAAYTPAAARALAARLIRAAEACETQAPAARAQA